MTDETPNIPQVYLSMGKVLSALSVAKGGVLPGNMGGKPYITAADIASEVKRLLVEHNLIVLPNEAIAKHQVIEANNRLTIAMVVEGEYTFVSLIDGSKAVVQGAGDGLANGTAVASNIASTNAMKNALLRTFLITEQSVEDYAKGGIDESEPAAPPKAIRAATGGSTQAPNAADARNAKVKELQGQIKAKVSEVEADTGVAPDYTKIGKRLNPKNPGWGGEPVALAGVLKAIEAGELE